MSKANSGLLHGVGNVFLGDDEAYECTSIRIRNTLRGIEPVLKNGVYTIPTGQDFLGDLTVGTVNLNILSRLTGGTITTGSGLRPYKETLTKSTTTITLSNSAEDTNQVRIVPVGSNKAPLVKVASSPSVGEFSISGATVTINASQTEDDFVCYYFYSDTAGDTLQVDPDDLPTTFELIAHVPMEDVFTGTLGAMIFHFAKVRRALGDLELGGEAENAVAPTIAWKALNQSAGDVKIYSDYEYLGA